MSYDNPSVAKGKYPVIGNATVTKRNGGKLLKEILGDKNNVNTENKVEEGIDDIEWGTNLENITSALEMSKHVTMKYLVQGPGRKQMGHSSGVIKGS